MQYHITLVAVETDERLADGQGQAVQVLDKNHANDGQYQQRRQMKKRIEELGNEGLLFFSIQHNLDDTTASQQFFTRHI